MKKFFAAEKNRAWGAWLLVALLWGSTYPVLRVAVQYYPPEFFAATRFLLAGSAFLALALILGKPFPRRIQDWALHAGVGCLNLVFCHGLIIYSAQYVLSGLLALLLALSPAFSALLERLIWGRRIQAMSLWGLILGPVGIALLAYAHARGAGQGLWMLAVIGAALFLALGSALSQVRSRSVDLWVASGIQMGVAGVGLMGVSALLGEWSRVELHPHALWTLGYLALFGSMVAYSAFVYSLKVLGPVVTGTYTYANIAVATLLAWLMLGEKLSALEIFALVLICMAIWLVQKGRARS